MISVGRLDSVDVSIITHGVFILRLTEERVSLFTSSTLRSFFRIIALLFWNCSLAAPSTIWSLLCRIQQIQLLLIIMFERWLRLFHYFGASLLSSFLTFFVVRSLWKIGVSRRVHKLFRIQKLCTLLLTVIKHFLITFCCFSLFILLINQVIVGLIFLLRTYLTLFNAQIIDDLLHLFRLTLLLCWWIIEASFCYRRLSLDNGRYRVNAAMRGIDSWHCRSGIHT